MAELSTDCKRYLQLGRNAVCIVCPDREFADIATEHLFLSAQCDASIIATIRYHSDDTIERLLPRDRKENVVYIHRESCTDGHEQIILGMFDCFTAALDLREDTITIRFGSQAPVQALLDDVLQAALQPVLDARGGFILHGACMARDGRAIVLMGNSGAGKSTTAFNLTRFGFTGYADDAVLVTPQGDSMTVWPLTRYLSLRPLSFRMFEKQEIAMGPYKKIGKKYYFAQNPCSLDGAALEHICFLDLSGETETHIRHLSRERTFDILRANNRHFSFMGRDLSLKYARMLAWKVPSPIRACLGTDLDAQGARFEHLFCNEKKGAAPQPSAVGDPNSRSRKAALIRKAWSHPGQEPLESLIPLLGDFDPKIFKLALGFFQTLPLARLKVLAVPHGPTAAQTGDPASWVGAGLWSKGSESLLEQVGEEVLNTFAVSWFKSAPLLYPFLSVRLAHEARARAMLETAWRHCNAQCGSADGVCITQLHLLNYHDSDIWATPDADRWWNDTVITGQHPISLYCWVAEPVREHEMRLVARLAELPAGSSVTWVPVIARRRDITGCMTLFETASSQGLRTMLYRRTPLCCIAQQQADDLMQFGAFDGDGRITNGKVVMYDRPNHRLSNPAVDERYGLAWSETHVRFDARPYDTCATCLHYGLGLCRGGFFPAVGMQKNDLKDPTG
jgi:hypothetical protein